MNRILLIWLISCLCLSSCSSKKKKTDDEKVEENQEKLKELRKIWLDSLSKKEDLSKFLQDNLILEAGLKVKEVMANWKQEDPCKICQESWFDQGNATRGNIGVCKRCRLDKDKDCPTFSKENEMIPCPQPECLKILNQIVQ